MVVYAGVTCTDINCRHEEEAGPNFSDPRGACILWGLDMIMISRFTQLPTVWSPWGFLLLMLLGTCGMGIKSHWARVKIPLDSKFVFFLRPSSNVPMEHPICSWFSHEQFFSWEVSQLAMFEYPRVFNPAPWMWLWSSVRHAWCLKGNRTVNWPTNGISMNFGSIAKR